MATVTIKNTAVITFPTPTADWNDIDAYQVRSASTGGNLLWEDDLDNDPDAPTTGAVVQFAAEACVLNKPDTGVVKEAGLILEATGLVLANCYVAAMSSDVELTGNAYARVEMESTDWTIGT